jgi:hypothetical protein
VEHADAVCALAPVQSLSVGDVYQQHAHDLARLSNSPVLARLRRLQFITFGLDWQAVARLGDSPHAAGLRELDCRLGSLRTRAVCSLLRSPLFARLTALQITGNTDLGASFAETLARLPTANGLRRLTLRDIQLAPGAEHFVNAPALGGLIHLRVENLGAAVTPALLGSPLMGHLESLVLSADDLRQPVLRALAGNPWAANLRRLGLSSPHLDAKAAAVLAESPHLRNLRTLVLRGTKLGDKGARALARSPHLAGLLHLDLGDCGVGDEGAGALLDSALARTLIRLDLTARRTISRISPPVHERLKKKMGPRVQP